MNSEPVTEGQTIHSIASDNTIEFLRQRFFELQKQRSEALAILEAIDEQRETA